MIGYAGNKQIFLCLNLKNKFLRFYNKIFKKDNEYKNFEL